MGGNGAGVGRRLWAASMHGSRGELMAWKWGFVDGVGVGVYVSGVFSVGQWGERPMVAYTQHCILL